ncbi:hypothetical protein O3P69_001948 [Scylla paramamosain]|uniref:Uncharacterized protein n=1 Tax=Scylla paramamosain TaxID=85552 RepID=A0AAW0V0Y2_SCYPA
MMQGDRGTSTTTATTDDEVLSPPKPEQPAQQSAQPEPVAGALVHQAPVQLGVVLTDLRLSFGSLSFNFDDAET